MFLYRTLRILFFFLLITSGWLQAAEWQVLNRKQSPVGEGHWKVDALEVSNETTRAEIHLAYFPADEAAWCVAPNLDGALEGIEGAVNSCHGIAGINGGYFESGLTPLGLLISKGKRIHPLQKAKLLSGIFAVRHGRPELRRVSEYKSGNGVSEAIQAGPFLIDQSRPVPGLNNSRTADRTFVFTCESSVWGIGICRSVTLAEMAEILATKLLIPGHRMIRAINFDGGSSSGFYVQLPGGAVSLPNLKTVSNYLVVSKHP